MKTIGLSIILFVLITAGTTIAREADLERLLPGFRHTSPAVRREAAREFVRQGMADPEAAIRILERGAVPKHGAGFQPGYEHYMEIHAWLLASFALGKEVAETEGAARWLAVEQVMSELPEHLRDAVLDAALGSAAAADQVRKSRRIAREVVDRFVREWNENYTLGSEEEKRYAALKAELVAAGPAAVVPLLEVLAIPSASTFGNLDEELGVTARMQVRAILGLSFLGDPVALPALYLHTMSISFTASVDAAAALKQISGEDPDAPFTRPDRGKLDAWWKEHRDDQPAGTAFLVRRMLDDLDRHLAREFLGLPETAFEAARMGVPGLSGKGGRAAAILPWLEALTGRDLDYDEKAPIETRIRQAAKIRAQN